MALETERLLAATHKQDSRFHGNGQDGLMKIKRCLRGCCQHVFTCAGSSIVLWAVKLAPLTHRHSLPGLHLRGYRACAQRTIIRSLCVYCLLRPCWRRLWLATPWSLFCRRAMAASMMS